jgi:hypothetical protein
VGTILHLWIGDIPREVFGHWLASAPIVIFGAPIGTYLVTVIPRMRLLYIVSGLCVFQFIWTLKSTTLNAPEWLFVAAMLVLANLGFLLLYRKGKQAKEAMAAAR